MTHDHDFDACPGDTHLWSDKPHPLIGTLHEGLPIVAVRTPECDSNGTPYTWVLPCDVGRGNRPHPCDWQYLRPGDDWMEHYPLHLVEEIASGGVGFYAEGQQVAERELAIRRKPAPQDTLF